MLKLIALFSALSLLGAHPSIPTRAVDAELLVERHYSDHGYLIDLYVTRDADGIVLVEVAMTEPTTGEAVDVWTDGETAWWDGVVRGETVHGSLPVDGFDPQEGAFCFTPVTAILCLGIAIGLAAGGCAHQTGCRRTPDPVPPDDGGDVPDPGGDGDGDSDDDDGSSPGGGDE